MNDTPATFRTMTTEHLGSAADEDDLRRFVAACERHQAEHGYGDAATTEYVYERPGLWMAQECAYCGSRIAEPEVDVAALDDADWERIAGEHADGCEWIATRAHTQAGEPTP